jgi:transcriptional regulator with XRE-family HTH domain
MDNVMESTGFAERLKALRAASGDTLASLSARAGLHLQSLARIERGEREPTWRTVVALAKALGVTTDSFLAEEPADPPPEPEKPKRRKRGE